MPLSTQRENPNYRVVEISQDIFTIYTAQSTVRLPLGLRRDCHDYYLHLILIIALHLYTLSEHKCMMTNTDVSSYIHIHGPQDNKLCGLHS